MTNISCIPFSFPSIPGVRCAFTTRMGGVSAAPFASANLSRSVDDAPDAVSKNITTLKEQFGIRTWAELEQVHGTTMVFEPDGSTAKTGDGMGTNRSGIGLVIKTADLQPIMLAHRRGRTALRMAWKSGRISASGYTRVLPTV